MNFLAHLYLSGDDNELKIGNFIADHVKGSAINSLPLSIKKGVLLHRKIDFFTDHHPVVAESKLRLQPKFRKYAPVIADVFYDHFLAVDWEKYSDVPLHEYADEFYSLALSFHDQLPERTRLMLPYMIKHNWLVSYSTIEGIHKVLTGMSRRTPFDSHMDHAAVELELNYDKYREEFVKFFEELKEFAANPDGVAQPRRG